MASWGSCYLFCRTPDPNRLDLLRDAQIPATRAFAHGAGGSGKTYCMTKVILPVYDFFMPGQSRMQASQNSAARLIGGETMHARAGLVRGAAFSKQEPSRKLKDRLFFCDSLQKSVHFLEIHTFEQKLYFSCRLNIRHRSI